MKNPYADDYEALFSVTLHNGERYQGYWSKSSVQTDAIGWWTLTDSSGDEWIDLNPAHIATVTPAGHFHGRYVERKR